MKGKFSKIVILSLILLTICFTTTILIMMYQGMEEPETLIKYWFTGFVAEMLACAGIKVSKVFRSTPNIVEDDDEEVPVG